MTNFLVKHFVKDAAHPEDPRVRSRFGKFAGLVGILSNTLLAAAKAVAGLLLGSVAVTADAINNLSDSASGVVTLVGYKLAEKPADEEHPFGHQRIEYISGLVVSFVVLMLGLQMVQESVGKILSPEPARMSLLTVVVLAVSVLVKLWQCAFYRNIGKRIGSATLRANAADSRNDAISTAVILLGLCMTKATGFNLDGYMGLAVAVLILITGVQLIKETSNPLLGQAPDKALVDAIYSAVMQYNGVLGAHDLTVHNYGPNRWFASVHCEVDAREDVLVSHDLIDNIERKEGERLGIHLVIHMDPIVVDDPRTNALRQQVKDMVKAVEPQAAMHDFRVVWGPTHANLIFDVCVPFACPLTDEELRARLTQGVRALDSTYYAVITIDRDYVPCQDEEALLAKVQHDAVPDPATIEDENVK